MTAAYSEDLRKKIVASYEVGVESQQEIADIYNVHLSTFKRIYKQHRETGSVKLAPSQAGRPPRIDDNGLIQINEFVLKKPDATLVEIKAHYKSKNNIGLSLSIICRALQKLNLRRKKKSAYAQEQEREDIKKKISI
jgi:transposase